MVKRIDEVWKDQPDNKHTWAFYYYLRRRGDTVLAKTSKDRKTITLFVKKHDTGAPKKL